MRELNLETLADGVMGISAALTACYLEAAKVAFAKHNVASGVILKVDGTHKEDFRLRWKQDISVSTSFFC